MRRNGLILIIFAWAMEIVGVSLGLLNSTYTTFQEDLPDTILGYLPALPMIALAVAELGRVPLASVIFYRHKVIQTVALIGLVALSFLAFENWTFGFERIVDLRLKDVSTANRELSRAESGLSALEDQHRHLTENNQQKLDDLRRALERREAGLASITAQLSQEANVHQKNVEENRQACRVVVEKCMRERLQAESARYEREVQKLSDARQREQLVKDTLQSQIDGFVSADKSDELELTKKIAAAKTFVGEAQQAKHNAVTKNQIYRIAAMFYRVKESDVTEGEFAVARGIFATFSAIAVASAGSIAALVYYSRPSLPGVPGSFRILIGKVIRARRAYYARRRKAVVREVPGPEQIVYRDGKEPPTVVEKEVVRFVDQIFLIPRWGINAPVHVNSLVKSSKGKRPSVSNPKDQLSATPNVRQLKREAS